MKNCLLLLLELLRRSLVVLTILVLLITCRSKPSEEEAERMVMSATLDSLAYGKEDYEQMMAGFRGDSIFMEMIDRKVEEGEADAIRWKKLLQTPYEQRFEDASITEYDIKLAIFSFRAMTKVKYEFDLIHDTLSKYTDPDLLDSILKANPKLDSIINDDL